MHLALIAISAYLIEQKTFDAECIHDVTGVFFLQTNYFIPADHVVTAHAQMAILKP